MCEYLSTHAFSTPTRGLRLLEMGCGDSTMLPIFANQFKFEVSGIDYSAVGCERAIQRLSNCGVQGKIVQTDFFSPPAEMLDTYDVVWSWGVIEHFINTAAVVCSFARFVKPGGLLITAIPNLAGAGGLLLSKMDKVVYDKHVVIDREQLRQAHEDAGLQIIDCNYLMSMNLAMCNMAGNEGARGLVRYLKKSLVLGLHVATVPVFFVEHGLGRLLPPNRLTSPYVVCVTRRGEKLNERSATGAPGENGLHSHSAN
jgi:2-polyprenyl-3-methyl-5-hydroxy-6-metoxy-1,4-benzoquinol methylase